MDFLILEYMFPNKSENMMIYPLFLLILDSFDGMKIEESFSLIFKEFNILFGFSQMIEAKNSFL